ncbi:Aminoacyl-tRNA hydrolase [Gloeothece citriformis PCC 7424]|uniref:Peptidyl-tRNA hydrolase n=1 Tax=Gloeothece citriformis (strain PCC 7424) TaxID=65393 RepID=B7KA80_GLOC7|nr:aminoacyl-tRNA hydrolase [Gloeothece citriformis]ACK72854.1 Aminoacyl-tRNA hydrolase [Gloeothece citriformis PCC 7424]
MTKGNLTDLSIPQLIIGLGNPEEKYEKTRHNIGFEAVDLLAKMWQLSWQQNKRFQGFFTEGTGPNHQKIRLLKPLTYMNRSGESVRAVIDWYKLPVESILVIYDDMDLPLGRIRLRLSGSAGGHNGIKSIISHVGGQNFPRLRIGIGKSNQKKETISHVLGRFSADENQIMSEVLQLVEEATKTSLKEGVEKAMSLYNNRVIESSIFENT